MRLFNKFVCLLVLFLLKVDGYNLDEKPFTVEKKVAEQSESGFYLGDAEPKQSLANEAGKKKPVAGPGSDGSQIGEYLSASMARDMGVSLIKQSESVARTLHTLEYMVEKGAKSRLVSPARNTANRALLLVIEKSLDAEVVAPLKHLDPYGSVTAYDESSVEKLKQVNQSLAKIEESVGEYMEGQTTIYKTTSPKEIFQHALDLKGNIGKVIDAVDKMMEHCEVSDLLPQHVYHDYNHQFLKVKTALTTDLIQVLDPFEPFEAAKDKYDISARYLLEFGETHFNLTGHTVMKLIHQIKEAEDDKELKNIIPEADREAESLMIDVPESEVEPENNEDDNSDLDNSLFSHEKIHKAVYESKQAIISNKLENLGDHIQNLKDETLQAHSNVNEVSSDLEEIGAEENEAVEGELDQQKMKQVGDTASEPILLEEKPEENKPMAESVKEEMNNAHQEVVKETPSSTSMSKESVSKTEKVMHHKVENKENTHTVVKEVHHNVETKTSVANGKTEQPAPHSRAEEAKKAYHPVSHPKAEEEKKPVHPASNSNAEKEEIIETVEKLKDGINNIKQKVMEDHTANPMNEIHHDIKGIKKELENQANSKEETDKEIKELKQDLEETKHKVANHKPKEVVHEKPEMNGIENVEALKQDVKDIKVNQENAEDDIAEIKEIVQEDKPISHAEPHKSKAPVEHESEEAVTRSQVEPLSQEDIQLLHAVKKLTHNKHAKNQEVVAKQQDIHMKNNEHASEAEEITAEPVTSQEPETAHHEEKQPVKEDVQDLKENVGSMEKEVNHAKKNIVELEQDSVKEHKENQEKMEGLKEILGEAAEVVEKVSPSEEQPHKVPVEDKVHLQAEKKKHSTAENKEAVQEVATHHRRRRHVDSDEAIEKYIEEAFKVDSDKAAKKYIEEAEKAHRIQKRHVQGRPYITDKDVNISYMDVFAVALQVVFWLLFIVVCALIVQLKLNKYKENKKPEALLPQHQMLPQPQLLPKQQWLPPPPVMPQPTFVREYPAATPMPNAVGKYNV